MQDPLFLSRLCAISATREDEGLHGSGGRVSLLANPIMRAIFGPGVGEVGTNDDKRRWTKGVGDNCLFGRCVNGIAWIKPGV